jgi:hypothetical protein
MAGQRPLSTPSRSICAPGWRWGRRSVRGKGKGAGRASDFRPIPILNHKFYEAKRTRTGLRKALNPLMQYRAGDKGAKNTRLGVN